MNSSIKDILAPLDPHWDRIVRRPLSSKEVDDLATQVGLPMPVPLRDYLMTVGLLQDLTYWQASSIEVYDSPEEFVSTRKFLCKILPPKKQDFFPFGHDGGGNVYCLPTAPNAPCHIHFIDHETRKISKRKDFEVWLQSVVAKVLRGIKKRVPNEHKVWAVQFAFGGISYDELKELLALVMPFKEVDSDWANPDTTPADVTSTSRRIDLNGQGLELRRLECSDWTAPGFYFDLREPLANGLEHSQIRMLNAHFKEKCPGYRLVDYGPLDRRELEKAERL